MSGYFPTFYEVQRCEDPIVDVVALDRAMAGDRQILEKLTALERDELLLRLVERYADPTDADMINVAPDEWLEISQKPCKHPPIRVIDGLWQLSLAWGIDYRYLRSKMASRVRDRRVHP